MRDAPMPAPAPNFGRQAFEFIDELDRLSSAEDIAAKTGNILARFGFQFFAFTGLVTAPGQNFDDLLLAGRLPDGFRANYVDLDYGRFDPNVHRAIRSSHPYEWTWTDYGEREGPRAAEVMRFFRDFHLNRGFIVPIHGAGGYEAGVAMAGSHVELAAEAKPGLHLMALYAFERLYELVAARSARKPPLTRREREVLAWSAQGKTAWEIGEILNVAKRTVDEHAQTAIRKLGAANCTQAVAIAIRDRLFDI